MRNIEFLPKAFKEYNNWIEKERRTALRIGDIIRDICRHLLMALANRTIKTSIQRILEPKD